MFQRLVSRNGGRLLRNLSGKSSQMRESHSSGFDSFISRSIPAQIPGRISRASLLRRFSSIPNPKAEVHPKSLDDFQHEEITGPTVERDESATGNELRESIDAMLASNGKLKRGLVGVGLAQLVIGFWMAGSEMKDLHLLYSAISCGISLQLAYVVHQTMKPVSFFQRVEGRSRMRTVILAMQSIKAATNLFARSNVVARYSAVGLAAAFAYQVGVPHFYS